MRLSALCLALTFSFSLVSRAQTFYSSSMSTFLHSHIFSFFLSSLFFFPFLVWFPDLHIYEIFNWTHNLTHSKLNKGIKPCYTVATEKKNLVHVVRRSNFMCGHKMNDFPISTHTYIKYKQIAISCSSLSESVSLTLLAYQLCKWM